MDPDRPASGASDSPEDASEERGVSRRSLIEKGAKLAFAVPAVLAVLPNGAAVASAASPSGHSPSPSPRARRGDQPPQPPPQQQEAVLFTHLCRAAEVPASDYMGTRGNDPLGFGAVHVRRDLRVEIDLAGAAPNATYEVLFVRFGDANAEQLGTVTTNQSGNFKAAVGSLSGDHRVGIFVLARNGADHFISCIHRAH